MIRGVFGGGGGVVANGLQASFILRNLYWDISGLPTHSPVETTGLSPPGLSHTFISPAWPYRHLKFATLAPKPFPGYS